MRHTEAVCDDRRPLGFLPNVTRSEEVSPMYTMSIQGAPDRFTMSRPT